MVNNNNFVNKEDLKRLNFILDTITEYLVMKGDILDCGCGTGIVAKEVGKLGHQVIGIDDDHATIEFAKSGNLQENVNFIEIDATGYYNEENCFDAIICSEVLEHLPNPNSLIQLVFKILKANGVFIVTVPNGKGPRELFVTRPILWLRKHGGIAWKLILKIKQVLGYNGKSVQSKAENMDHLHFFTMKDLKKIADNNGFKIVKLKKTNFISGVFPLSLITRHSTHLQAFDCWIAEKLPYSFSSGFLTIWIKK